MKRILTLVLSLAVLSGCSVLQKVNWDPAQLQAALGSAMTAASITDEQIALLSKQTVAQLDAENIIENGAYTRRLNNILKNVKVNGVVPSVKVYKKNEVNAFACGDGSIRVYSGLMDIMDDNEILAIVGHEIGHVVHQDTKNALKAAYLTLAARNVLGAAGGTIGALSNSAIGDIAEAYVSAQYSQKQEFAADEYGFEFSVDQGADPYSMCNSLEKLVRLSETSQMTMGQKMFSSHPDSVERANRMRAKADAITRR